MPADQRLTLLARLMDVAVLSNEVHAANLANSNTPGYRAKAVAFDSAFQSALDSGGPEAAEQGAPALGAPAKGTAQ